MFDFLALDFIFHSGLECKPAPKSNANVLTKNKNTTEFNIRKQQNFKEIIKFQLKILFVGIR